MRERPNAADLIEIARAVLRGRLLPAMPESLRYEALMVANALANAERELKAGPAPLAAALARLADIYGDEASQRAGESLEAALARVERRLARDIREGRFDGDRRVLAHLLAGTVDAVRESNPRYLDGRAIPYLPR
jgi:hypothetical protein